MKSKLNFDRELHLKDKKIDFDETSDHSSDSTEDTNDFANERLCASLFDKLFIT